MHDLAGLLAKTFIARSDVKAVQNASGEYMPVQHCEECGRGFCDHKTPKIREPWKRADIDAHVAGTKTYGHYLLNHDDQCKLFAFDIDFIKYDPAKGAIGQYPEVYDFLDDRFDEFYAGDKYTGEYVEFDPRAAWLDRGHPGRQWLKTQLRTVSHTIMRLIREELEIPVACAYTGNKGMHVYGFTGLGSAADAREGAQIVIDSLANTHLGSLSPTRGTNFYKFDDTHPHDGQPNIEIEVFPKQDSLDGKDLGNLMRLPLGKNLKNPKDPTFFVDMTSALNTIKPLDPVWALTEGSTSPWRHAGE